MKQPVVLANGGGAEVRLQVGLGRLAEAPFNWRTGTHRSPIGLPVPTVA
jgi:hypothetical protein